VARVDAGVRFDALVSAPLVPFTANTQVGPPSGTSFTSTTGLPTADATEDFVRTDPLTGSAAGRTACKKYVEREWTSTITLSEQPAGDYYWFHRCRFSTSGSFFGIDITNWQNGGTNRLLPSLIFTECEFVGNNSTDKVLAVNRAWFENCDLNKAQNSGAYGADAGGAEDAIIGASLCTFVGCNIRAGVGNNTTDPHSDGVQIGDTGASLWWRSWISGGSMSGAVRGNAAMRVGTEFGDVDSVKVYYCGFGGTPLNTVQFRGDARVGGKITGVEFVGNRWVCDGAGFLNDFQQGTGGGTMIAAWSDNKVGANITLTEEGAYSAGTVVASPGI
jgi:hypothetical protein